MRDSRTACLPRRDPPAAIPADTRNPRAPSFVRRGVPPPDARQPGVNCEQRLIVPEVDRPSVSYRPFRRSGRSRPARDPYATRMHFTACIPHQLDVFCGPQRRDLDLKIDGVLALYRAKRDQYSNGRAKSVPSHTTRGVAIKRTARRFTVRRRFVRADKTSFRPDYAVLPSSVATHSPRARAGAAGLARLLFYTHSRRSPAPPNCDPRSCFNCRFLGPARTSC